MLLRRMPEPDPRVVTLIWVAVLLAAYWCVLIRSW